MTLKSAFDPAANLTPPPLEDSCPYLGTGFDRTVHFGYPTHENICFATGRSARIEIEHQDVYCLTKQHAQCPRYAQDPVAKASPAALTSVPQPEKRAAPGMLRYVVLGAVILLLALTALWLRARTARQLTPPVAVSAATATPTATPAEPTATEYVLQAVDAPTPLTPTTLPAPSSTPTAAATATATATATPTATATARTTATPTATALAAATPTLAPTNTPTVSPTDTPPPPTPTQLAAVAPALRTPLNNAVVGAQVTFSWDWSGPALTANQGFEVRVWREDQPDHYGAAAPVVVNTATIDLAGAYGVQQGGNGRYFWTVALIELNPYRRIGLEAAPRQLQIDLPGGGPTPAPTLPP